MIFEDIANVMNARPVKEIMRKTGLTKNRVYSLRMGCTFHMDYELLFALQRMGYEVHYAANLKEQCYGIGLVQKLSNVAHTDTIKTLETCFRGQVLPGACEY